MIDDDIYNRIIENKAKNGIIKMNRNYSNVYGELNTFMRIMFMKTISLDMWMFGPFHNKSGLIVSWENVWRNNYVHMYKVL